jgi:hypothetical protein
VSVRRLHGRLTGLVALAALVLAGCASGSPQTGAGTFVTEHGAAPASAVSATRAVESAVSRLSSPPTRGQLGSLADLATQARRDLVAASGWNVAGRGEEGAEEEDVPRAETQVTEGAGELAGAMSALSSYSRAPSAAALASYRSELASGRTQWDEGISQLWYLARDSRPPTV